MNIENRKIRTVLDEYEAGMDRESAQLKAVDDIISE